jgi:DNA-binding LacI/PurR family transcriptional regulator
VHTIAYVSSSSEALGNALPASLAIRNALQNASGERGWSLLNAHTGDRGVASAIERIREARASGIVLDAQNEDVVEPLVGAGLPVVMVNSWIEDCDVNIVLQDNYRGGFLAARHLIAEGCRRVAWIGPVEEYCHSRERFAGATAGLRSGGCDLDPTLVLGMGGEQAEAHVRKMLSSSDRPDGVLVFWHGAAVNLRTAAAELGLAIGRDLRAVGWTTEELYDVEHASLFAAGQVPPAIVWRAASMAEAALVRLGMILEGTAGEPYRCLIPTRVRTAAR